ncbi:nitronate monooxygenase [Heyndrickxia oleronia]|uniref:nitronate monooxygenase n=1 Tax=Heyndrickxia TaxID=2837504 RepID=UPI003F51EFB4
MDVMHEWMQRISVKYPIVQAPMAGGITTPQLVAAVSNEGALGMIGAGYLNADQTRQIIREVKSLTTNPFGINLFVPEQCVATDEEIRMADKQLRIYREELKIHDLGKFTKPKQAYEEQIRIIIEEEVPVCSFTFGLPTESIVKKLKEKDILLIGTATTVKEAQAIEAVGLDIVVAQGSEAGGHRGSFLESPEKSGIGLMSLIPQINDHVTIPVIAAGGIMDKRGLKAATCLGAQGVQMGTAFLTCKESGAHPQHKKAIIQATEDETVLTSVFSGKYARGVNNHFIQEMSKKKDALLCYPYQNELTKDIRRAAGEQNNPEFMSLWSGQSPRLSKEETVAELIQRMVND